MSRTCTCKCAGAQAWLCTLGCRHCTQVDLPNQLQRRVVYWKQITWTLVQEHFFFFFFPRLMKFEQWPIKFGLWPIKFGLWLIMCPITFRRLYSSLWWSVDNLICMQDKMTHHSWWMSKQSWEKSDTCPVKQHKLSPALYTTLHYTVHPLFFRDHSLTCTKSYYLFVAPCMQSASSCTVICCQSYPMLAQVGSHFTAQAQFHFLLFQAIRDYNNTVNYRQSAPTQISAPPALSR